MRIIITGATGAFGGAMVRHFAAQGHDVIASGRKSNPPKSLLALAEYVQADITKPFELPDADVCIHGAALSDDKASSKELYLPNIVGTENTIEAASKCKKFIFVSSSSVYLPQQDLITEEIAGKQNNKMLSPYGHSKLLSEETLRNNYKGDQCFILRPRAFYGVGDTQIIPRMMKLVKNEKFNRPGKLDIQLSMTHYTNMAAAIECCIESELKGVRTYNVADDETYVMIEVLRKIFSTVYGKKLAEKEISIGLLKVLAFFRIAGFTPLLVRALTQNMVLDISKIKQELNYQSAIKFEESLNDIKNWIEAIGGYQTLLAIEKLNVWGNEVSPKEQ
ncbi:NAD(P)-dependent oxidoreductase [Paracrocinitomix mangrovi]|uniref:NAD-dependent epimerase/dehydratase family protein n=1 Tax=Paracrocinitomix mangrovi TaxID=2862509 RepID=UPI001C8CFDFB|nr:NAD(P)-dependent oxidoreductase [Paracrocinitomix mangrovi]UKN00248.1 NAD(P)-dependent oxidoreductase [Paracrocinitomix mangrovi]